MSWNGKDGSNKDGTNKGVKERGFTLDVEGREVPGVYWAPEDGSSKRLVLLGHGGTTHKKVEYIERLASLLVARGMAAIAIDGPGHGDRRAADASANTLDEFPSMWNAGGGTEAVVADWNAALNFIEAEEGARPTGWWGLSMGTMMGLPVTATDKRIKVALLGLMGGGGVNGADLLRLAPEVQCPVRFLLQWDDELIPLKEGLELFDRLGTKHKTLHVNPGLHSAVPMFEMFTASVDYLDQRLK